MKSIKLIIFEVNNQKYAADVMEVERILGYSKTTKIPDCPDFVDGVINYEGNILPVISLAKKFKLKDNNVDEDSRIIVAKEEDKKIGIIVDVVDEIEEVDESTIEKPDSAASDISKRYIKGLIKKEKDIIIFLNLFNVLTDEQKQQLEEK